MKVLIALLGAAAVFVLILLLIYWFASKEWYGLTLKKQKELQQQPAVEAIASDPSGTDEASQERRRPAPKTQSFGTWQVFGTAFLSAAVYGIFLFWNSKGLFYDLLYAGLVIFMTLLAFTDVLRTTIPNRVLSVMLVLYFAAASAAVLVSVEQGIALVGQSLGGALLTGGSFLLCYLLTRGKLGGGDVKLSVLIGLYFGRNAVFSVIAGMVVCCIWSLIMLCTKKIKLNDGIPLVPFLYFGVLVTLLNLG